MINKGFTDASIQNYDKEKVNEVDSFMERVTLPQNTLQHFRDRGIELKQPKELRIVLIGKVSEGIGLFSLPVMHEVGNVIITARKRGLG